MIGKPEWLGMADQIHKLEMKMRSTYAQLEKQVFDPELKEIFAKLVEDEGRHAKAIQSISSNIINS